MGANIIKLPTAATAVVRNVRVQGPKPRGITYLPALILKKRLAEYALVQRRIEAQQRVEMNAEPAIQGLACLLRDVPEERRHDFGELLRMWAEAGRADHLHRAVVGLLKAPLGKA